MQNHAPKDLNKSLHIHYGGLGIFVSRMTLQPLSNKWKYRYCAADCVEKAKCFNPEE
jgi:hypothetical protein